MLLVSGGMRLNQIVGEEEAVEAQMKCNPRCRESDSLDGWELLR